MAVDVFKTTLKSKFQSQYIVTQILSLIIIMEGTVKTEELRKTEGMSVTRSRETF